jgi:hypothetical protein
MGLGTELYSEITRKMKRPIAELLCQWIKTTGMDFSGSDSHRIKKYSISNETDGRGDKEGNANVCIEHKSVSSECDTKDGNCENTEAEIQQEW